MAICVANVTNTSGISRNGDMEMFQQGDRIGIVCCSNGQKITYEKKIKYLENTLLEMGLCPVFSDYIYESESIFSGTSRERAQALMKFYQDEEIKGIFDISGGDAANGILPYLDYEMIAKSSKLFWGYSDLTTVINAIYAKTGKESVLYQIRNLIYDCREKQMADFQNATMYNGTDLFQHEYKYIQGNKMQGVVIGGNIRCFLKLAGTEYMPNPDGKILFLEALSGTVAQIETYFCQLQQMGVLDKVAGILLGTFTEMEREKCLPTVESIIRGRVRNDLPIAVTADIGHGTDSKAILIGGELCVNSHRKDNK